MIACLKMFFITYLDHLRISSFIESEAPWVIVMRPRTSELWLSASSKVRGRLVVLVAGEDGVRIELELLHQPAYELVVLSGVVLGTYIGMLHLIHEQ